MKLVLLIILLISSSAYAQFKCVSSVGECKNPNDNACRFVSRVWSSVKEKEDEWAKFLRIDIFDNENSIKYSSFNKYCSFRGYRGANDAQISLVVLKDSKTEQKYEVLHSACGRDQVLVETWEIQGKDLASISDRKVKKDILFSLNRKFDLRANETYKSFTLESKVGPFESFEGNRVPFEPFKANSILQYVTQKIKAKDSDGVLSDEIRSFLKIFDKDLYNQNINTTKNKTRMYFHSPSFPFYGLLHRFFFAARDGESKCDKAHVDISFDEYLLIKPSRDQSELGLTYNELQAKCLNRESTYYRDQLIKILEHRMSQYFPRFKQENVAKSVQLENDIKKVINFIEAGDVNTSLDLVRKLLVDVRSGKIKDER